MTDQSFAQTIRRFSPEAPKRTAASYFLGCGIVLWVGWQITNLAGYVAGNVIPEAWSLDFAVPLCFIALLTPLFRDRSMLVAGVVAGIAVVLLAGLPMRLGIVVAGLVGIVAGATAGSLQTRRGT